MDTPILKLGRDVSVGFTEIWCAPGVTFAMLSSVSRPDLVYAAYKNPVPWPATVTSNKCDLS